MRVVTRFKDQMVELFEDGSWRPVLAGGSALERLRAAVVPSQVKTMLTGLFDRVRIEVIETGEKVTAYQRGGEFMFEPDDGSAAVDFDLRVHSYQIDNLIENAAQGYADALARFRLVREFFQALPSRVQSILSHGITTNAAFRKLINSKDMLHLYLVSPDPSAEADAAFTVFFVNGSWNVAQGLAGKPDRVFRMTVDQALELLRHGLAASKASMLDLPKLAHWYIQWRRGVEVAVG